MKVIVRKPGTAYLVPVTCYRECPMTDTIIHESPWPSWYATQDVGRGVSLHDRSSGQRVTMEPPTEWGRKWSWNITEDGTGIYFKRTG